MPNQDVIVKYLFYSLDFVIIWAMIYWVLYFLRGSRGVSDAVFMTSRDGVVWDRRHMGSLVDGGSDERSWTQRSNMVSRGVLRTGDEFSLYITRRYCWEDARLVRYAARPFGFSALEAGDGVGTLRTKPVVFSGETLFVNFATAAPGSLRAGLIDPETGRYLRGFSPDDCDELFGDALNEPVRFQGGSLAALNGRPVAIEFTLRLARLFAFHFGS